MRKLSHLDFPLQKYTAATSRYELVTDKLSRATIERNNGYIKLNKNEYQQISNEITID